MPETNTEILKDIDEMIALRRESLRLLEELRETYALAGRAGVDAREVDHAGYDPAADGRWTRPEWRSYRDRITPEVNYLVLRDGRRIDVPIDWRAGLRAVRGLPPANPEGKGGDGGG